MYSFTDHTFTNCGQGLELGFSSPNHTVTADSCYFLNNHIGIRLGDNYYGSDVDGNMFIKNSFSLNNDKDIWNMIHKIWAPEIEIMQFTPKIIFSNKIRRVRLSIFVHFQWQLMIKISPKHRHNL